MPGSRTGDFDPRPWTVDHFTKDETLEVVRVRGIDLHTISNALGHSSLRVTENYLKGFDQHAIDDAMDELFGGEE